MKRIIPFKILPCLRCAGRSVSVFIPQSFQNLSDGRVEIDKNLDESVIRPTAIGKNLLCVGAAGAGERSAIIYTVIESCRGRQIDP